MQQGAKSLDRAVQQTPAHVGAAPEHIWLHRTGSYPPSLLCRQVAHSTASEQVDDTLLVPHNRDLHAQPPEGRSQIA